MFTEDIFIFEIPPKLRDGDLQILRLTSRWFAKHIPRKNVNLLEFGAEVGVLEFCELGKLRNAVKYPRHIQDYLSASRG